MLYAGYAFNHAPGLHPTGFLQKDNIAYAAFARQYIDEGPSLGYANPFNTGPGYAKIYFQVQELLLAGLLRLGLAPGLIIPLFSCLFFLLTVYVLLTLYETLFPRHPLRSWDHWLLLWGGGMLVLAGALVMPWRPVPGLDWLDRLFYLDPAWGWWGLSLGRALIPGLESYYHFLFFLALLFLFWRQWLALGATLTALAFSHPFTSAQLLAVLWLYGLLENGLWKRRPLPAVYFGLLAWASLLVAGYYFYYLPSFADHRSVSEQYALNWNLRFYHFLPAYLPVYALAIGSVLLLGWKAFWNDGTNRFFFCLFLASLLLANHELFIRPHQPIHFTRGYEWTACFFLGRPALHYLLNKWRRRPLLRAAFLGLFLLDNFLWIGNFARFTVRTPSTACITTDQQQVLQTIGNTATKDWLVISNDETISYLTLVYSPAYSWYSHPFTAPFAAERLDSLRRFYADGTMPRSWENRPLLFVFRRDSLYGQLPAAVQRLPYRSLKETPHYRLLLVK